MHTFIVWCPLAGEAFFDGLKIEARSHDEAAQLWAEENDLAVKYPTVIYVTLDLPRIDRRADEVPYEISIKRRFGNYQNEYRAERL